MILPNNEFWQRLKETNGALSCAEALMIVQLAAQAPEGNYMELGVNRGKSAFAASFSLPAKGIFYLVEPEFADKEWKNGTIYLVSSHRPTELQVTPEPIADYSYNVIDKYGPYSYLFWDSGEHGGEVLQRELALIEDAMVPNGLLVFHDYKNQFTAVEKAYQQLLRTGKYEEVTLNWQPIFDYVKEHDLETGNNSWHQYPELPHPPNFVGALKRK